MRKKRFERPRALWAIGLAVALVAILGCGKKESNEPISLKGRIEKVTASSDSSAEITVRYFNEKQNQEMVGKALVTPQTRIEKGGAAATIQDLQEGMQVQGQVRIEKIDGEKKFTAIHIRIENPTTTSGG